MVTEASYRSLFARDRRALVLAASGASFLVSFDALMMAASLPSAARDLAGLERFSLVVGAYAIMLVLGLPVSGWLIARAGPLRALIAGVVLYAAGAVIGVLAPTIEVLAAGRAVTGLGGGMLLAAPPAIYTIALAEPLRRYAYGLNSAVWGLSALLGPLLGSFLASGPGWRWVFVAELVPLVITLTLALGGARGVAGHVETGGGRLAPAGPVLLALATLALLVEPTVAIVPVVLFLWHERRTSGPVFPATRPGRRVSILILASGIAFMGSQAFVVLDLQSGAGWSVGQTALPLIAATVAWTIGSVAAAPLHLDPDRQLVIGHLGVVAGCAVMALPVTGGAAVAAGITLAGFGMGVQSPAAFIAIAPDGDPRAAAAVPLARNLGAGVGVAAAGAVITAVAGSVALAAAQDGAVVHALHSAAQTWFLLAAVVCAAALPLIRLIR
jgi:MFS family permease